MAEGDGDADADADAVREGAAVGVLLGASRTSPASAVDDAWTPVDAGASRWHAVKAKLATATTSMADREPGAM